MPANATRATRSRRLRAAGLAALGLALVLVVLGPVQDWLLAGGAGGAFGAEELAAYTSNLAARLGLAFGLLALLVARPSLTADFFRRFVGEAPATALGLSRLVVAGVLLLNALWEDLPSLAAVPPELLEWWGVMGLLAALPGWDAFVASPEALAVFAGAVRLALLLAFLGVRTRLSVPVAAALYLVFAGLLRAPFKPYHTGLVPWMMLAALAFFPSGDALSVDARRGHAQERSERRGAYGWGRFTVAAILTASYVEAGLSKLCNGGFRWWDATNLREIFFRDALNPMEFESAFSLRLVDAPDLLFEAAGVTALLGEALFVLALVTRGGKLVLPGLMIGMHAGILLTQNILFFDLFFLCGLFFLWPLVDREPGTPFYVWDLPLLRRLAPSPPAASPPATSSPATAPAPVASPRTSPSPPRLVPVLFGVLAVAWVFAIELFPLTAMQMYSPRLRDGVVDHYRVVGRYADGSARRFYVERAIPALRDGRYRHVLRDECFAEEPTVRAGCDALMRAAAAEPVHGPGLREVAIEHRRWAFRDAPQDPAYGTLVGRHVVAVDGQP
ncbi:MAG: hypothetical protein AAF447_04655 [Myxococcota bacterium]